MKTQLLRLHPSLSADGSASPELRPGDVATGVAAPSGLRGDPGGLPSALGALLSLSPHPSCVYDLGSRIIACNEPFDARFSSHCLSNSLNELESLFSSECPLGATVGAHDPQVSTCRDLGGSWHLVMRRALHLFADSDPHMLLVISEVTGVLAANTEVAVAAPSAVSSTPEGAPPVSPTRLLTPREREIMNLVLEGHTSRMIASILSVSLKTVEAHRSNVLRKLGVRNSTQLAAVVGRADV